MEDNNLKIVLMLIQYIHQPVKKLNVTMLIIQNDQLVLFLMEYLHLLILVHMFLYVFFHLILNINLQIMILEKDDYNYKMLLRLLLFVNNDLFQQFFVLLLILKH
jgi:hypothetical protein